MVTLEETIANPKDMDADAVALIANELALVVADQSLCASHQICSGRIQELSSTDEVLVLLHVVAILSKKRVVVG